MLCCMSSDHFNNDQQLHCILVLLQLQATVRPTLVSGARYCTGDTTCRAQAITKVLPRHGRGMQLTSAGEVLCVAALGRHEHCWEAASVLLLHTPLGRMPLRQALNSSIHLPQDGNISGESELQVLYRCVSQHTRSSPPRWQSGYQAGVGQVLSVLSAQR